MKSAVRFVLFFFLAAGMLIGCMQQPATAQDSWAVYVYMCGSDLESMYGAATFNLNALRSVQLPENVKFFIQTGGAKKWHTGEISSDALGRYVYDQNGFREIAKLENANMGAEETLKDFLSYAKENFPADHKMLVFWNHGGGSLDGLCFDERYAKSLSLPEVRQALETVEKANPEQPVFDLVVFDACLMATLETANTMHGYSRYMVASEEIMPESGTDYAGWAGALAQNPSMGGRELGTILCDTYIPHCTENEGEDMATLSLIDLAKVPNLNAAYEALGREALGAAQSNPRMFYTTFDRVANSVENYGFNSGDLWHNMIDLGSFSEKLTSLGTAADFTRAVKEAVVCRVVGPYRQHGMGLSGYYCLDGSPMTLAKYTTLPGASPSFFNLYENMLAGSGDGNSWYHFNVEKIEHTPVVFDQNNTATVTLTPEDANSIREAAFHLSFLDEKERLVFLGSDCKLTADWNNGIFRDNFDGAWPALNGHFISMEIDEQQDDYILYHSYILLNGQKCYLRISFHEETGAFEIIGAHRLSEDNLLDRNVLQLKQGDEITPLFLTSTGEYIHGDSFVLEQAPLLQDEPLPDGTYAFAFQFTASRNDVAFSEYGYLEIDGDDLHVIPNEP